MPDASNAASSRTTKVRSNRPFPCLVLTHPRMKMAKSKAARRKQQKRKAPQQKVAELQHRKQRH